MRGPGTLSMRGSRFRGAQWLRGRRAQITRGARLQGARWLPDADRKRRRRKQEAFPSRPPRTTALAQDWLRSVTRPAGETELEAVPVSTLCFHCGWRALVAPIYSGCAGLDLFLWPGEEWGAGPRPAGRPTRSLGSSRSAATART